MVWERALLLDGQEQAMKIGELDWQTITCGHQRPEQGDAVDRCVTNRAPDSLVRAPEVRDNVVAGRSSWRFAG